MPEDEYQDPTAERYEQQLVSYRDALDSMERELAETRRFLWWALRAHGEHHIRVTREMRTKADDEALFARFDDHGDGSVAIYALTKEEAAHGAE